MSAALLFLATGIALLILLLLWVRRSGVPQADRVQMSQIQEALAELHLELPPRILGERIFAQEDWEFVRSQSKRLEPLFVAERRRLALLWVRQMRRAVGMLMNFHRQAARETHSLRLAGEVELALQYGFFILFCQLLAVLLGLWGPFRVRRWVGYAMGVADKLSVEAGRFVAGLDPTEWSQMRSEWGQRGVAGR